MIILWKEQVINFIKQAKFDKEIILCYNIIRKVRCLILINRKEEIKKKGFAMTMNDTPDDAMFNSHNLVDFSKIKVGAKILDDAILNLGTFKKIDARLGNKETVLRAIYNNDYETMREISDFFFKTSGIYARLCKYMANLYRYDWMVTPYINDEVAS